MQMKGPGMHEASKATHRRSAAAKLVVAMSLAIATMLLCGAGAALAAAPETPSALVPSYFQATTAWFTGTLNPGKAGEPGTYELDTYEFLYRASKTECQGGSTTTQGMSLGGGAERLEQFVEGLQQGTTYTYCLLARNGNGETALSAPVTFTTPVPPAVPQQEEAVEVTKTTATLKGVLNAAGAAEPGSYYFRYQISGETCENEGSQVLPAVPGINHGARDEAVQAAAIGLLPGTTYTFCLYAESESHETERGAPVTFTTTADVPAVAAESATEVGAGSALVSAQLSARGLSTSYRAEFLTEAQFQAHEWAEATRVPATDAELPAGDGRPLPVAERLTGLQAGTAYRFRFLATNALGQTAGEAATFTTTAPQGSVFALPDERVDELVSTSGNFGEPYVPTPAETGPESAATTRQPFQASADGEAIAYIGEPGPAGGNGNTGSGLGDQWLATRSAAGWSTQLITPDSNEATYQAFSPDLAIAYVQTDLQPPLAPGAPAECQVLYSRAAASGAYTALVTSTLTPGDCGNPLYAGESRDGSQMLIESEAALTPGAQEATEVPAGHQGHSGGYGQESGEPCMFGCNLYEAEGGHLNLVNVLPDGKTVPNATFGGYAGENHDRTDLSDVISADGSRVFWTDTQAGVDMEHVYVRENGTSTARVSGSDPAEFWTATPDGRYALYVEDGRLWRFDVDTGAHEALTAPAAGVEGVIGANDSGEDGAYVYFVASGVLAANTNAHDETAQEGAPNLYVREDGATSFIATLSPEDDHITTDPQGPLEDRGDWVANLGDRTAEVTPDGRHIVFESVRPLTGYDNIGAGTTPIPEVFVYDAARAQLACASCDPTGAPPRVANVESPLPISSEDETSTRRWISEKGGRVFFDSVQSLIAQEPNGTVQDVYEWEAPGEGTCTAALADAVNDGCVFLLSGGESSDYSFLVETDAKGENVFFEHRGSLGDARVPVDRNQLYDARVAGGFPRASLACAGAGCQGVPPAPPIFATPASVTFAGVGNFPPPAPAKVVKPRKKTAAQVRAGKLARALKACRQERHRKRDTCTRRARARYGSKRNPKGADERRKSR